METRIKSGFPKPNVLTATKYPLNIAAGPHEPSTVSQALASPKWKQAMITEYEGLLSNGTWSLVPPPASTNVVGNKWVFETKFNPDGSAQCHKARLVTKRYHQTLGIDFYETFSSVIKPTTVRIVWLLQFIFLRTFNNLM
ncbi:uncharacterized mitochondrial protein AtMg00820-like [Humulus lupulus]|uniref:uncharacterized mitochondrial protein AtMg00820-like n=1 Tax=Humulus lupulus TaxID=3486 RepID=UPI002B400C06|nr:uncharacterized mitochondrial protein AtMg00820-like [Humulus lupulus]